MLIVCIMFLPGGLVGVVEKARDMVWQTRRRRARAEGGTVLETTPLVNPEV